MLTPVSADVQIPTLQPNIDFLFVQTAHSGSLQAISGQPGTYTLTLYRPEPYLVYFSDRPNRIAGLMPFTTFLYNWQHGADNFKQVPPNAGLEAIQVRAIGHNHKKAGYAIELTKPPIYNAQQDTVSYTIRLLKGDQAFVPQQASYRHVALFIDEFCLNCVN